MCVTKAFLHTGRARSAMYVSEKLQYKLREDLMDQDTSEVWIEVNVRNRKKETVLVGQFYREMAKVRGKRAIEGTGEACKQKERLQSWLSKVQEKVIREEKTVCLGGDFNAHINNELEEGNEKSDIYGQILEEELIDGGGMKMIVKESTHQEVRNGTNCRARCIDQIYCNSAEKIRDTRVVMEGGSGHQLVMTTLMERMEYKGPQQHKARIRKNYNKNDFLCEMDKLDWTFLTMEETECEKKTEHLKYLVHKLSSNIRTAMDSRWPMRIINKRVKLEQWLDDEDIMKEKKEENEMWKAWRADVSNQEKRKVYDQKKKYLEGLVKEKKSQLIQKEIFEDTNNQEGQMWKAVKRNLNWVEGSPPTALKDKDGKVIMKPEKVAERYHEVIQEKVEKIAREMDQWREDEETEEEELKRIGMRMDIPEFQFKKISQEQMRDIIHNLPKKSSTGTDEVSYIEIKDGEYYVAPLLTEIINGVIETGYWPDEWKSSIIKPLYKSKGVKLDAKSYRPVSLTSALGRTAERVLNSQLIEHLLQHNVISEECHGFVPGRGTATAVLEILETLQGDIERGNITTLLGCDISGAFDVLDRSKLLQTLERIGMKGRSLMLVRNYFLNRKEKVQIGAASGKEKTSTRGVLQGSGLSPLFFLLYFLRSCQAIRTCEWCKTQLQLKTKEQEKDCKECGSSCVYTDDHNEMGTERKFDKEKLKERIKTQGEKIESTLRKLLLLMNNDKTQFIVCCHTQCRKASRLSKEDRKNRGERIVTHIGGEEITETEEVKTLGVKFDSSLRFEPYWKEVRGKMMKKLYGINQIKSNLNFLQRKQLGNSLIMSRASYCIEATSCCTRTVLNIPKRIMNRTARILTNNWDDEQVKQNYRALGMMEVEEMAIWRTYKMAVKIQRKRNPQKMLKRIVTNKTGVWEMQEPDIQNRTR